RSQAQLFSSSGNNLLRYPVACFGAAAQPFRDARPLPQCPRHPGLHGHSGSGPNCRLDEKTRILPVPRLCRTGKTMDKMTALTIFVAAAEHGSFSRAAEQLGKTPSAITKAVAHLESELGVRLFERTTRRMALTEAGNLYLEGARQALMHLQRVTEEVEQLQHELRGTLRITAPPSFGPAFLNQVCCRF